MNRPLLRHAALFLGAAILTLLLISSARAIEPIPSLDLDPPTEIAGPRAVKGQILVQFSRPPTVTFDRELAVTVPFTSLRFVLRQAGFSVKEFPGVTAVNKRLKAQRVLKLGNDAIAGRVTVIDLPEGVNTDTALQQYKTQAGVEAAEPNYLVQSLFTPNDPYFQRTTTQDYQWNLHAINMPQAWDMPIARDGGGPVVKVAVIDSGVAFENFGSFAKAPELVNVPFVSPKRFQSMNPDCETPRTTPLVDDHPNDDDGHGTHVAATIAQATDNGAHAAGIAFSVSIMPVKVMMRCTSGPNAGETLGSVADIVSGIGHAVASGASVINMSLGLPEDVTTLRNAVTAAANAGVVVVAASGNEAGRTSSPPILYPAKYPEVIAVGAVRFDGTRSEYSQYGPELDLTAPGGQVAVDDTPAVDQCIQTAPTYDEFFACLILDQNHDTLPDGIVQQTIVPNNPAIFTAISTSPSYGFRCVDTVTGIDMTCGLLQGTSMASPHVAAAAALVIAVNPTLFARPSDVRNILTSTASKNTIPGYTQTEYGAGLLNVAAALTAASGGTGTPTPTPTQDGTQCLQVLTPARCADGTKCTLNSCQTFPTSCLPDGWVADPSCAEDQTPTPTMTPQPTVTPGGPTPTPSPIPSIHPVSWTTKTVSLEADNLEIGANGQLFYPPSSGVNLNSDPGGPAYTTLETVWFDGGIERRLFMYLRADETNWWVDEIRTYGGAEPGKWIYYTGETLSTLRAPLGTALTFPALALTSNAGSTDSGFIHFQNLRLKAALGTTVERFQLLVGDVNDTNTITIEDIAQVLSKYTDFKIPVAEQTSEDVNADTFITIEDVALVLLNYNDFTLPGE